MADMKFKLAGRSLVFAALLLTLISGLSAQEVKEAPEPILVDEFGTLSHCDFRGRIDSFLVEISNNPDHRGFVLTYKSVNELPGDRNSYPVEQAIAGHISFRNFDSSRITFMRPGYLAENRTQFWRVPPGAVEPRGADVLPRPSIPVARTFLFAKEALASDSYAPGFELGEGIDELLPEFVLESVKARERAEQAEIEKTIADEHADHEDTAGKDLTSPSAEVAPTISPYSESQPTEDPVEDPADTRTEEERHSARFEWANGGFAEYVAARKGSTAVIIFYADDERYDIRTLKEFVKQGRDLLAAKENIRASRLKIVFGGYRDIPTVEFWFVPAKGRPPLATPDERPVQESEAAEAGEDS
jgi:hypothetical protein